MEDRIERVIREYDAQGIHRTGTAVDDDGATWLSSILAESGAEVGIESFEFERLDIRRATLRLGDEFLDGVPAFDGGATPAAGITGTIGEPGSSAPIAMLDVMPFEASESARALARVRSSGQHEAIIAVTDTSLPPDGAALLNAERFASPFGPPVLQVPAACRDRLHLAMTAGETVGFICDAVRVTTTASNVGARLAGANPDLAPLVVMTPRSGWWRCASERGGGIAALVEIAHALAAEGPDRDVIFTANTGHELGHIGLEHFLTAAPSLVGSAHCWIHLGANFAASRAPGIRLQYSDAALREAMISRMGARRPAVETPLGTRPVGEARNVHDGRGRYVSIVGTNGLFHHPADTWPDAVDADAVRDWIDLLVSVALAMAPG